MNENKKITLSVIGILLGVIIVICLLGRCNPAFGEENLTPGVIILPETTETTSVEQMPTIVQEPQLSPEEKVLIKKAEKDGYKDVQKWLKKLKKVQNKSIKNINKQLKVYKKFMTTEHKQRLKDYRIKIKKSQSIKRIRTINKKINWTLKDAEHKKSFYDKSNHRTTITRSGGVYYYNGHKETYYSSNVLYHYRTPEWVCDDEGFWRTKEGYYVVATDSYSQGTIIHQSKGECMVLDCGCGSNIDYYVNW